VRLLDDLLSCRRAREARLRDRSALRPILDVHRLKAIKSSWQILWHAVVEGASPCDRPGAEPA